MAGGKTRFPLTAEAEPAAPRSDFMIKTGSTLMLALAGLAALAVAGCSTTATGPPAAPWPVTSLHYASNGNYSQSGRYLPAADGFNLADAAAAPRTNWTACRAECAGWCGWGSAAARPPPSGPPWTLSLVTPDCSAST